jgi:ERF superfamily
MTDILDIIDPALPEPPTPTGFVVLAPGTIASDFVLANLNKSLGQAQNEFDDAVKSKINTYGGYGYTPLSGIIAAVRPSLTKYHLTVSQFSNYNLEDKTVTLYSRIVHWDSGEWMQNSNELPAQMAIGKDGVLKFNHQTIGGTQTYAQKYAYKAIVGIPDSEEMVDGSDEHGSIPQKTKDQVKKEAQQRVTQQRQQLETQKTGAISHQEKPSGGSVATVETHPLGESTRRHPDAYKPQAGGIKFIPPNGLTTVIKRVEYVAEVAATPERPKGVRPFVNVFFTGEYRGCDKASCFDTKFWELLKASVGLECHFQIKEADKNGMHFINIVDVIAVDGQEHVDGQPLASIGK